MAIVRIDGKGRIQLPHEIPEAWRLKPKQALTVQLRGEVLAVRRATPLEPAVDPVLRDILLRLLRSKVRVTKKLLDELKEEQWSA